MVFEMLLGGLQRGIAGIGVPPAQSGGAITRSPTGAPGFHRVMTVGDLWTTAVTNLKSAKFNLIGSFTVPADEFYSWGNGAAQFPDNQGFLYFSLGALESTTAQQGLLRLAVENNSGTVISIVKEFRSDNLAGSTTDRQQQVLLPEQRPLAKEDSKLTMYFKPDTDDITAATKDNTVVLVSTTRYIK